MVGDRPDRYPIRQSTSDPSTPNRTNEPHSGVWTEIDNQQIDANTIVSNLETLHQEYLEDLYATNGGSCIYTIKQAGGIAISKGMLEKVWNINIEQRQVVQLQIRRNNILKTIYAGYEGTIHLYATVPEGNHGEKVEVLDVRPLPIQEFANKIHFTMQRPQGDLRVRYDSSTLEKITIKEDKTQITLKEKIGAEQETHIIEAKILDYFVRGSEAYIEVRIGTTPQNVKTIRICQNEKGEHRLILKTTAGTNYQIRYVEADDLFTRIAYDHFGRTVVSITYISRTPANLDRITGPYQLSAAQEPITVGPYGGYRTYGKILSEEKLEILRKKGPTDNQRKGEMGRNVAIKVLEEKLGFSRDKILVKRVSAHGSDIPATDSDGNRVSVQVKLATSRKYLAHELYGAIDDLRKDLRTGQYKYGYAVAIYAGYETGELIIEWVKVVLED